SGHNLAELEVKNAWLSVDNLNPMPMLTSLTFEFIRLDDEDLNELNRILFGSRRLGDDNRKERIENIQCVFVAS
nr:hypothetical protein [Tanacetum cinerariifolium]